MLFDMHCPVERNMTALPFQVLERGSHQELVELGGKYAEMWRIQNREGEEKKEEVEKDKGGGEGDE